MKTALVASVLTLALVSPAKAQIFGRKPAAPAAPGQPATSSKGLFGKEPAKPKATSSAPRDPNVFKTGDTIPEPAIGEDAKAPVIPAPAEPIDAVLLQKEHGPFMVMAHSFTGPEAAKYAHIMALELRREYHLPAYVWLAKVQPMRSNIQQVQPTAPPHARNNDMAPPERFRVMDEAAVLVGNCKTIDESKELLKQVKKIRPTCLDSFPVMFQNRRGKGLNRAIMTTNPFAASQHLYPGGPVTAEGLPMKQGQAFDPFVAAAAFEKAQVKKVDPDVVRWNEGPYSIFKNPASFTLQVAEFTGRTGVIVTTAKGLEDKVPENKKYRESSPLMTAAEDAETLAASLNKCKSMGGMKAYTYHTRFSSFVTIGQFKAKNDPAFQSLQKGNQISEISNELIKKGFGQVALRPSIEALEVPKTN